VINFFVFNKKSVRDSKRLHINQSAISRMREISVEEGVGMLHFDIVRSQGLEGRVSVDMATEPGTADTTADVSAVQLVPVQVSSTAATSTGYIPHCLIRVCS